MQRRAWHSARRARHNRASCAAPLALACLAAWPLAAQEGRVGVAAASLDAVDRRIAVVSPAGGPPGTVVTLETGGLPAVTPVRIGVGAVRFGFEEVAQVMTTMEGTISLTVEVPSWARRDLTHVFIVFDFYFAPIALSDPFHVTGPDGTILRRGRLTRDAAGCATLEGEEGVLYAVRGLGPEPPFEHEVAVEGRVTGSSGCGGRTLLDVVRIGWPEGGGAPPSGPERRARSAHRSRSGRLP